MQDKTYYIMLEKVINAQNVVEIVIYDGRNEQADNNIFTRKINNFAHYV